MNALRVVGFPVERTATGFLENEVQSFVSNHVHPNSLLQKGIFGQFKKYPYELIRCVLQGMNALISK